MPQPPPRPSKRAATKAPAKQIEAQKVLQGEYLKPLRTALGLTQIEVAKALGFQESTMLGNYENGRDWVNPAHYKAYAEVLGVSLPLFTFKMRAFRDPEAVRTDLGLMKAVMADGDGLVSDIQATIRKVSRVIEAVKREG